MATPGLDVIMGWMPNYDNPHEPLDAVIYGVNITLTVLMTVFVAGRFVLAMGLSACQLVEPRYGIGRHLYDVRYKWYPALGKLTIAIQALFAPCSAITKISIWFGISTTATLLLQCMWPMSQKQCIDSEKFYIAVAAINSIKGFMVYLWPIHYLWKVKLSVAKGVGLMICFGVGVLICIAGLFRITWQLKFANSWDQIYNEAIIFVIVAVECNLGVVCGCIPGLRLLMSKIFPGLTRTTHYSGRGKNSHAQISSNYKFGGGYPDLHSIHVRKDVELSIVAC
ncbi:hypothetical protein BDW75DRAFT_231153 [Aspergillus navahoensis]